MNFKSTFIKTHLISMGLAVTALAQSPFSSPSGAGSHTSGYYPGVNLAGAEFGKSGGSIGKNYVYPNLSEFQYFQSKGMKIIRIPFRWERIQPELRGELDSANLAELDRCVAEATKLGLSVLLDVHNYGARPDPSGIKKGLFIGMDPELPGDAFNDLWVKLATHYKDNAMVWFGLMNEPHKHPAQLNAEIMQSAVNAIRATGAKNMILVPGTWYSGAHSWIKSGNAEAFKNFKDPANNFAYEVHQYLDKDNSGTHAEAVPNAGSTRLTAFTQWAKQHHAKGFLGEFGWDRNPDNKQAQKEGEDLLNAMDKNKDVWIGYAYWSAGSWWTPTYMYLLEPEGLKAGTPVDRAQMSVISKHLK